MATENANLWPFNCIFIVISYKAKSSAVFERRWRLKSSTALDFLWWLIIFVRTIQVLYSRTMPRVVLAFWRRWSKTKSQHLSLHRMMRIHCCSTKASTALGIIHEIEWLLCCFAFFSIVQINAAIVTFDILQNGDRNLHCTDGTSMIHFTQCLFHLYNEDSYNYNEDCFILYICILYVYIYVLQACSYIWCSSTLHQLNYWCS